MTRSDESTEAEPGIVQEEVIGTDAPTGASTGASKPEFKAAVGLSREWDARKAGREVAEDTLKKLDGKKPDFFLLFSTIHYEKHGGFNDFLAGVWEVLPEGTPLIGGTVAGFMNNYGCYTRGATAMAVSYPNMDVAVGIGRNTKRRPRLAAKECADQIKQQLKRSKYENKFIYEIISGCKAFNLPGIGKRKVIKSEILGFLSSLLADFSLKILQRGVGREEEILDALVSELPDYTLLGMSSIDDNNMLENYQFYNNKVVSNSIVALSIKTDLGIDLNTTYGLNFTPTKLKITKTSNGGRIINKIDNKPAIKEFLRLIGWPDEFIDERILRRTLFTPLGCEKNGLLFPNVFGVCIGKNVVVGYKIESDELRIMHASGNSLISAVDENLSKLKKNSRLILIVSCAARLETLGSKIFLEGEKTGNYFNNAPFLITFAGGEDTYSSLRGKRHVNESFNVITLG